MYIKTKSFYLYVPKNEAWIFGLALQYMLIIVNDVAYDLGSKTLQKSR